MLKFQRKLWPIAFHGGAMAYYLSLMFSFLTNASVVFVERMITTWYMAIHINFIILTFAQDLICVLLGGSSRTYKIISKITNLLFISTVFPFALYIPLTYWILFYYNKNLIHPTFLEVSLPPWVSTGSHSVITLVALAEMMMNKHTYEGNYLWAISILVTFSSCYAACLIITYQQFGFWIYPVFHLFSDKMLPFVFVLLGVVLLGIFFMGSMINKIIHGKSQATNVTNVTSSSAKPIPKHKGRNADQFEIGFKPCSESSDSPSESPILTPDSYLSVDRGIKGPKPCRLCDDLRQQEERFRGAIDSSKHQAVCSVSKNKQVCCTPDDELSSNTLELTEDRVVIHNAPFRCNSTTKIAFETVVQDDKNRLKRQNAKSKYTDVDDSISCEEGAQRPNYKGDDEVEPCSYQVEPTGVNQTVDNKPLKNNKELRDFVNFNLIAKNCKIIDTRDGKIAEEDTVTSSSTEDSIVHSGICMGSGEGQQLLDSLEDSLNSARLSIQNGIISPNLCLTKALTSYMHHIQKAPTYDQKPETSTQHEPIWNVHHNQQSSYLHYAQRAPISSISKLHYDKQTQTSNTQLNQNHHIPNISHIKQSSNSEFPHPRFVSNSNLHHNEQALTSNFGNAPHKSYHAEHEPTSNQYTQEAVHSTRQSTSKLHHAQQHPSNAHHTQHAQTSNLHQRPHDPKQHTQLGLSCFHHTRHAATCSLYHTQNAPTSITHQTQQESPSSLPDPPSEHTINAIHTNTNHNEHESIQNIPLAFHQPSQNLHDDSHETFPRRSDLLHVLAGEENSPLSLDDMILAQTRSRNAGNVYTAEPHQTGTQNSLRLLPIEENSPLSLDDMKLTSNQFRAVANNHSMEPHQEHSDVEKLSLDEMTSFIIPRRNEDSDDQMEHSSSSTICDLHKPKEIDEKPAKETVAKVIHGNNTSTKRSDHKTKNNHDDGLATCVVDCLLHKNK